jgi:ATP-binding cassette subfamily B protein
MTRLRTYALERAAGWLRIVRLAPAAGRRLLAVALVLQVLAGLVPLAFIVATSVVVGRIPDAVDAGLDSPEWRALRDALLVTGALFLLQHLMFPLQWTLSEIVAWRVDDEVRERIARAAFASPGIEALSDQRLQDDLAAVVDPHRGLGFNTGDAVAGLLALIPRYLQWAGAAVLLGAVFTWWAALVAAIGALLVRIAVRTGLARLGAFEQGYAPHRRRLGYYWRLLSEAEAAKEVRLFGLVDWLRARHRQAGLEAFRPVWRVRRRTSFAPFLASLPVAVLLSGVASIAVARASARGELTLGELALALQAIVVIGVLSEFFFEADYKTEFGLHHYDAVDRLEQRAAAQARHGTLPARGLPREEIRFEGVRFAYPGAAVPVFDRLDLSIPAGHSLAIVGLNGAGKTTLVKLLARLYEPDAGRITADGVDLRELDARAWQARIAAIFQDFVHYDLPLAANVGFGAPALLRDRGAIERSLERAGAGTLAAALPAGLETVLSREYEGGAELSGGQWQRVALARAFMAVEGGAGVLVLDEPTANLDVRAEAALFDRFLELTSGLTTILISHRFSTVRRAHRIVVLEEGAVVEDGTHEELVAHGGRYAQLFRLQASQFEAGDA